MGASWTAPHGHQVAPAEQEEKRPRFRRDDASSGGTSHPFGSRRACPLGHPNHTAGASRGHLVVGKPSPAGPWTRVHTCRARETPGCSSDRGSGRRGPRSLEVLWSLLPALLGTPAGGKVAKVSPVSPFGLQEGFLTQLPQRCSLFPWKRMQKAPHTGHIGWEGGGGAQTRPTEWGQDLRVRGQLGGSPLGHNGPAAARVARAPHGAPGSRCICGLCETEK